MVNIILVNKNGELKLCKYNKSKGDELYKKCKFKKNDNFKKRTTWTTKKKKYNFSYISLYSRDSGKANNENKYEFPPPVDSYLYFGECALVAEDKLNKEVNLSIEQWNTFYEELFGGFENLDTTEKEDDNEIDELDIIPDNLKTRSGYLKDDFVVDDNHLQDSSYTESDYDDNSAELEMEEYCYSDE
jgi:hypothetical protein